MGNKIYAKARFGFNNKPFDWWEQNNPVLENGEPGIVSDAKGNGWLKIGDGVTPWKDLPWKVLGGDLSKKMDKFGSVSVGESGADITLDKGREISFSAPTSALGTETYYDFTLVSGGGIAPEDYTAPDSCFYMKEHSAWAIDWNGGGIVAILPDSFIPLTASDCFKVDLENNVLYVKYNENSVAFKNVASPTDGRDAANKNYVDRNVGDINAVLAAIVMGNKALPKSIINKVIDKAAASVETKVGNRFVTAVAVKDTGSITVEPNAAYCIISNTESGKIVVYDRTTDEPVEFTGKIIGMITGNYGDSNPASVLGLLGIYSSALITKGTYLAIDSSKSATFSWEGEATVITVKNIKGE